MKKFKVYTRNKELKNKWQYMDTYIAADSDEAIKVCMADFMRICTEFGMSRVEFLSHCSHIEFKAEKVKKDA